jgi:hypothetical protein
MSNSVLIALVVAGAVLLVFFTIALRFPDVIRRLSSAEVTLGPSGAAIKFAADAIQDREHRAVDSNLIATQLDAVARARFILWVDDDPVGNRNEIEALRGAGVHIDTATTNNEAEMLARKRSYDTVISDIARVTPEEPLAGLQLPHLLKSIQPDLRYVYYVRKVDTPTTRDGYPIVNRPSELFRELAARHLRPRRENRAQDVGANQREGIPRMT